MVSPSLAVTCVPPARDQPAGSASVAMSDFTVPVVVLSMPPEAAGAKSGFLTLSSGWESAAATFAPATGASVAWLTAGGDRSTGLTASRAIEPVCEPSTAAAGILSPG